ncbi:MAG: hypothetical protein ACOCZE_04455 [Planctomycetota bacterium]
MAGRLLHVGSMSQSLGIYVPAKVLTKALALARMLLCVHLLSKPQYALWLMAAMVIDVGSLVLSLGTGQSLARYTAGIARAGRLRALLARAGTTALLIALSLAAAAGAAWQWIGRTFILADAAGASVPDQQLMVLTLAAIGCATLTVLWWMLCSVLYGLRTYLLLSVLELQFAAAFIPFTFGLLAVEPTAAMTLGAYAASMGLALLVGLLALPSAIGTLDGRTPSGPAVPEPGPVGLWRFFRYGLGSLGGLLAWKLAMYVGLYLAKATLPESEAAVFGALLTLSTMALLLGDASWTVVFTHAAGAGRQGRQQAISAFKRIALGLLTLSVLVYLGSPLWIRILPGGYAPGAELLAGLLTMSQSAVHLGLLLILCRLDERPWAHGLAGLAGAGAIWGLYRFAFSTGSGPLSLACGLGMYAAGLTVAGMYFLLSRARLGPGGWLVLASPLILLAPRLGTLLGWAGLVLLLVAARQIRLPYPGRQRLEQADPPPADR